MKVYKVLIEYEDGTNEYLNKGENGNSVFTTIGTAKVSLRRNIYNNKMYCDMFKVHKKAISHKVIEFECVNPIEVFKE